MRGRWLLLLSDHHTHVVTVVIIVVAGVKQDIANLVVLHILLVILGVRIRVNKLCLVALLLSDSRDDGDDLIARLLDAVARHAEHVGDASNQALLRALAAIPL